MCHTGLTRCRPHNGKPHLLSPAEAGTGRATHAGRRPKNRSRKSVKRHLRGRGETCLSDLVPGVSLLFGCGRLSVWSVLFRVLFSVPVCCSPLPVCVPSWPSGSFCFFQGANPRTGRSTCFTGTDPRNGNLAGIPQAIAVGRIGYFRLSLHICILDLFLSYSAAVLARCHAMNIVLGSNMTAICSNMSVYVSVAIFALVLPVGVLVGFEAARFLSATGVGLLFAVACSCHPITSRTRLCFEKHVKIFAALLRERNTSVLF